MKKIKFPEFTTMICYIEGNPKELKERINLIMKNYGLMMASGKKVYDEQMTEHTNGRSVYLVSDVESENCSEIMKAIIIMYNTNSFTLRFKGTNPIKHKIKTISHEIRHTVDKIIKAHHITDDETPAYLTGHIAGELLS